MKSMNVTSYEGVSTDDTPRTTSKRSTRAAVTVTIALLIILGIVLGVLFGIGTLSLPSNTNTTPNSISNSIISSSSTGSAAPLVFPPVVVDLSLTGNFSTININIFTSQFITDVSLLLQINSSRILVLSVTPGSIHVQFEIKPLSTLNQTILDDPNRLAFLFIHKLAIQDYNTTDPAILFNKYPFNLTSGYTIAEFTTPTTTTITGNEIITGDLTVNGDFFIGNEKISNGINGTNGRDGRDGIDGNNSTVPGPQGPPGFNGTNGKDGKDGFNSTVPGPQGPAGGASGKNGTNGTNGKDGLNSTVPGPPGRDGKDGLNSTFPGPQGPPGFNGTDGKDGKDGKDGLNSTVPGPSGPPGINGTNGAANIPITTIAHQVLQSTTTSGIIAWSNAIYPANTTINQLLYSITTNNVTGLPTLASAGLLTNSNGVPGWVLYTGTGKPVLQTNPTLIGPTLGVASATSLTLSTPLAVTSGGTGVTSSTGSGSVVLNNSPTLVNPNIGAATGSSLTISGQSTFSATLTQSGSATSIATISVGSNTIKTVFVQGRYTFLLDSPSGGAPSYYIYDVNTPSTPVPLGFFGTLGHPGTGTGQSLSIQGNYLYTMVVDAVSTLFNIYDISNVAAPYTQIGSLRFSGQNPPYLYVAGRYAYVAATNFFVVDIQIPSQPLVVSTVSFSVQIWYLTVQGAYAYVITSSLSFDTGFNIIAIENPLSPVQQGTTGAGSISDPNGGAFPGIFPQGRYVYVVDGSNNFGTFYVIDVSNPASPAITGSLATAQADGTSIPTTVWVQDKYAYVGCQGGLQNGPFQIIDVSVPATPVSVAVYSPFLNIFSLVVQGRYAYLGGTGQTGFGFQIYDLGGTYTQQLEAGGIETGTFATRSNAAVGNDLDIKGGLSVGSSVFVYGSISALGAVNNVQYKKLIITFTQIDAMGTTTAAPILSAPGSGLIINMVNTAFIYTYATSAFTGGGSIFLQYGTTVGGATTNLCAGPYVTITGTDNLYSGASGFQYTGTYANAVNQPVTMTNTANTNYAGGFPGVGYITLHIWYNIVAA